MSDSIDKHSKHHQGNTSGDSDIECQVPDVEEAKSVDQAVDVKGLKAKAKARSFSPGGLDSLGNGNVL